MTSDEQAKLGITMALVVGGVMLAMVAFWAVALLFGAAAIIDIFFRFAYNDKLKKFKATSNQAVELVPEIKMFEAGVPYENLSAPRFPGLLWEATIPKGLYLEIYRTSEHMPVSYLEAKSQGILVIKSSQEQMLGLSPPEFYWDETAHEGTWFYTPYIVGRYKSSIVLEYSFLSFSSSLKFSHRNRDANLAGQSKRVPYSLELYDELDAEKNTPLPDERSHAQKHKDAVLSDIKQKRSDEQDIEKALAEINADPDLTEREKAIAIERFESSI